MPPGVVIQVIYSTVILRCHMKWTTIKISRPHPVKIGVHTPQPWKVSAWHQAPYFAMKDSYNMAVKYSAFSRIHWCPWLHVCFPEVCKWGATCCTMKSTWNMKKRNIANTAALMKEGRADLVTHYHTLLCYKLIFIPLTLLWGCPSEQLGIGPLCILLQNTPESRARTQKSGWTQWGPMSRNNLHSR